MNPTLDILLVVLVILAALAYLARRFFGKKKGCSNTCACDAAKQLPDMIAKNRKNGEAGARGVDPVRTDTNHAI